MTSPERVAIIGTGLIGTSVAMAALRAGSEVRGVELDPEHARTASERAGIDVGDDMAAVVAWASLVVVATPVAETADAIVSALSVPGDATVTDVASVKGSIASAVRGRVSDAVARSRYVGGHPMGGTERTGPAWAAPAILDGISWVIAADAEADPARVERLETWIRGLGSVPVRIPAARHDRLVATVSHLPQIASTALMDLAAGREAGEPDALLLAAGGFRDLTRLAASNPELWAEILVANRDEVLAALDAFAETIGDIRGAVEAGERAGVADAFSRAKRARLELSMKPKIRSGVAVLQIPIPDRPGALASLTATLADVNIEDLQIVHSAEGGAGIVHLTVALDALEAAEAALLSDGLPSVRLA